MFHKISNLLIFCKFIHFLKSSHIKITLIFLLFSTICELQVIDSVIIIDWRIFFLKIFLKKTNPIKNQKCFIDGDSVTTQNTFNDNEKLNQDINKLIQVLMGNQKYQSLIQTVNG
jgi:hypothetical protein